MPSAARLDKFGYDDSLDPFGVHGIGGLAGALFHALICLEIDFGLGHRLARPIGVGSSPPKMIATHRSLARSVD